MENGFRCDPNDPESRAQLAALLDEFDFFLAQNPFQHPYKATLYVEPFVYGESESILGAEKDESKGKNLQYSLI